MGAGLLANAVDQSMFRQLVAVAVWASYSFRQAVIPVLMEVQTQRIPVGKDVIHGQVPVVVVLVLAVME